MDKNQKERSRSRSDSDGPYRHSRTDRRYSPSSSRSGSRRRRSSSRRHHSSSRSSRRSHHRQSHSRRRSRSRSRCSSTRDRTSSTPRHSRSKSPREIRKDPTVQKETDEILETQFPSMGVPSGKKLPKRELSLQPYKYLPPDLKTAASERRSRRDLTYPEYMCGTILMLLPTISPVSEAHAVLKHFTQVSQDAATLPWPAMREWTRACMAHIEDGNATWQDQELFASERTCLSWIKGRQPEAQVRAPCPRFNTDCCKERKTHSGAGHTWLHVCATCYYLTAAEHTTHAATGCWKKTTNKGGDDHRQDTKRKSNNSNSNNSGYKKPKTNNRPKN